MDLLQIISILGALGLFIFGMKVMSDGIQKVAGDSLRSGLAKMTNTRLGGVLTGFGTTAIIQSSSATTVMVVSFVNAGLLSLKQAIGVIMGANIGTTVTALIIVIFGFKFKITAFALPVLAIAVPMMLAKKDKIKYLGEFLVGFSILFIGLGELKGLVPNELGESTQEFISSLGEYGFFSTLLMVLVGTLVTIMVQSSSAAIAITLTLCQKGFIPFEMAAAIVLGENIGTTITANIAAVVGNTAAKRAARAHLIFNLMGVLWMLILFTPFLRMIEAIVVSLDLGSPFENVSSIGDGLTAFHMTFNIINTLLLVWFVSFIAKVVTRLVPEKASDEGFQLKHITEGLIATPAAAIDGAKRELELFAQNISQMASKTRELFANGKSSQHSAVMSEIRQFEELADQYDEEISNYIVKVASDDMNAQMSGDVRKILNVSTALERAGDELSLVAAHIDRLRNERAGSLSTGQIAKLESLFDLIRKGLEVANENLGRPYNEVTTDKAREIEASLNELVIGIRGDNLKDLENKKYDIRTGIIYRDIFNALESVGDHLLEIAENLSGDYAEEDQV